MVSTAVDRRTRKRLATRQAISDAATRLFIERGFDQVTVGEIAEAADVGRMTVFNHFPRKEDMFFDLDRQGHADIIEAMQQRDPNTAPIEALRLFAHRIVVEQRPYTRVFQGGSRFMRTISGSETLKARARAIRDELAATVRSELTKAIGRDADDPDAHLAAGLLLATWTVAFSEAHEAFEKTRDSHVAQRTFLTVVDQGTKGIEAAVSGSPYV